MSSSCARPPRAAVERPLYSSWLGRLAATAAASSWSWLPRTGRPAPATLWTSSRSNHSLMANDFELNPRFLLHGTKVGEYTVESPIDEGGQGVLYRVSRGANAFTLKMAIARRA